MSRPTIDNTLFYGDNLPILREYIANEIDLFLTLEEPTKDMVLEATSRGSTIRQGGIGIIHECSF